MSARTERLPNLPITALHWDGTRFVALLHHYVSCGCSCSCDGPWFGGPLAFAALDEAGTVLARGTPTLGLPAPWAEGPSADFAFAPDLGYVVAYTPTWGGRLHVALLTGPPP